ncbi:unnamed protein product [Effrenium voratum]|uniref:PARP catalytic domain-containing protein n=1 Tax=Effrenium voratum TaxID=2562239 RepID=A0AA36N4I6_9DINO|nr:unnamed protein product [Effrenium voratum]
MEPQRAKVRVTGVVKKPPAAAPAAPSAEAWSTPQRGFSTGSPVPAEKEGARVVNTQVNRVPKVLVHGQHSESGASIATREPSPPGNSSPEVIRKRPISAHSKVVVRSRSKSVDAHAHAAATGQELASKPDEGELAKLRTENQLLRTQLQQGMEQSRSVAAEKMVLQAEKDGLESRFAKLESQLAAQQREREELLEAQSGLREEKEALAARCQALERQLARRDSESRKVGWAESTTLAVPNAANAPNDRPTTGNSMASGTIVNSCLSFESAASHASLIYCSSPNSLRSVAEWVFPLQNRILPPEKTYDRQLLAPSDPRRQWLEEYIQGSLMSHRKTYDSEEWCSPPQIEIIRVSEVFNPIVNNAFYQQLNQMTEVWGTDRQPVPELHRAIPIRTAWDQSRMNEVLLFHGCKWDSLFGILREGFDPRLGGINTGAAFGIGCYFTTAGRRTSDVGSRKSEVGSRKSDASQR